MTIDMTQFTTEDINRSLNESQIEDYIAAILFSRGLIDYWHEDTTAQKVLSVCLKEYGIEPSKENLDALFKARDEGLKIARLRRKWWHPDLVYQNKRAWWVRDHVCIILRNLAKVSAESEA